MMDDTTCNCQWCMLFGKKEEALPSCDTTFLVPISYLDDDALNKLVDWETAENLPQSLAEQFPSNLIPLRTTGDGNCLLHAISRALFGVEVFNELLRKRMYEELRANAEWYCKVAPQFGEEDWKRILDNAGKSGSYLEFMHIFALSNVIARPIVIYANDGDMDKFGQGESGVAATFVPSRVGQAKCRHRPLILAWQSRAKNHYVPLVQIADREAVLWPALAPAFPNSLVAGETYADYLHFDAPVIDPPLLKKLEEQRIERQKKEELIQLMSRAFTGQAAKSPRGKGKEKKLDDEDEMDEEDEGEYDEDSTRDQREALSQLKKYIEDKKKEQQKEEDAQRKKILELMDRMKREREEQIKRDLAKRPRTEKLVWRGKVWDIMCYADLGDSIPRIIAWNKQDDIPTVVKAFLDEQGEGYDKHDQLVELLAKKTLRFIMEELARSQYGLEDDDKEGDGEEDEEEGKKQKQKSPRVDVSAAEPVTPSVAPLPICQHVPKRRGAPVLYAQGQLDGIHKKLLQFNTEFLGDAAMGKHSASAAELELISRTLNTLRDTAAYGTTNFSEPEFALIDKFLGWPAAKLFPVLDIHRLLILHPRAAEHYVAVHSRSPRFLDDLLARLQISAQNPQTNCMIALKFFANMFAHPACENVAAKNAAKILESLTPLAGTKDQRIKLPVANVVLNFSSILCDDTTMTSGKRCALALIKQMLQGEEDPETLYPLLISLGTLMYGDRESTTFVAAMALEKLVHRHRASANAKIAEAAQDVLDLLKW